MLEIDVCACTGMCKLTLPCVYRGLHACARVSLLISVRVCHTCVALNLSLTCTIYGSMLTC